MPTDAPSWDDLAAEHTPRTASVRVCLRGDLVDELNRLEIELAQAKLDDEQRNTGKVAPGIAERVLEVKAEADQHEREFVFAAIGQRAWSALLADHPPTPEERKEKGWDHNPETFPYEAVARSCTNVRGDADGVRRLADKLSLGDWNRLWTTCLGVNVGGTVLPKCASATALLQRSEPSSTTAPAEGSPEASS